MALPVKPHTHTPTANAKTRMRKIPKSVNRSERAQYNGKATSVPNVPGALRASPLPKPNDSKCAGWLSRNFQPGLTNSSPEVFIAASLDVERIACRIAHDTAAPGNNFPDTGQRHIEPCGNIRQFLVTRGGSGKTQLVIVSAGQDALPYQRLSCM